MTSPRTDTIAAIATAAGRGAVGILRVSGPEAARVACALCITLPEPRRARLRKLRDADGQVVDEGLVLYFPGPDSFTGEDVIELQGHGGPLVLSILLASACAAGARLARPGEFSERAFLNGRLDLAQAESIADLIDAGSHAAVRAASRSLQGEFSARVGALVDALMSLRADLEAALDFADEDVPWLSSSQMRLRLDGLRHGLADVLRAAAQGRRLRDGLTVAIGGQPNVGKSTLLNRLAGAEAAIVSPIAGTTRDVLREHLTLDGLPVTVFDTAGLRDSDDPIERIGMARGRSAIEQAEVLLWLVDDGIGPTPLDAAALDGLAPHARQIQVLTKCDLSGRPAGRIAADQLRLSAASGAGIEALVALLHEHAGLDAGAGDALGARARHLDALRQAEIEVSAACGLPPANPELIAEHLRRAQQALEAITGRYTADDLLGRIFATFCLGK